MVVNAQSRFSEIIEDDLSTRDKPYYSPESVPLFGGSINCNCIATYYSINPLAPAQRRMAWVSSLCVCLSDRLLIQMYIIILRILKSCPIYIIAAPTELTYLYNRFDFAKSTLFKSFAVIYLTMMFVSACNGYRPCYDL